MDNAKFKELASLDCSKYIEKKNGLSYLTWSSAWKEFKLRCPDATYEIERFTDPQTGAVLPYTYDHKTGYMVFTKITVDGLTHEMWLPVMDSANKPMKEFPYEYEVGFGQNKKKKTCAAADMFDINKTIMRCLVKNLAMFGLGLSIYAGEDIPEDLTAEDSIDDKSVKILEAMLKPNQIEWVKNTFGVESLSDLTKAQYTQIQTSLHAKNDQKQQSADN